MARISQKSTPAKIASERANKIARMDYLKTTPRDKKNFPAMNQAHYCWYYSNFYFYF